VTASTPPDGALLFARYAYPPNSLGYCGPDQAPLLLEYGAAGEDDGGLGRLARGFEGAWPYLRLIAEANRIEDPLDGRVVGAYWVGNRLLARVDPYRLCAHVTGLPGTRAADRDRLVESVFAGAVPHHNFHVFGVYPWVGMLRLGYQEEPLRVLERCRVRWGTVVGVEGEAAVVRGPGLAWEAGTLRLGPDREERALLSRDGRGFVLDPRPGETVSLHWDWVCDRLSERAAGALRHYTRASLDAVNRASRPAPSNVLG